MNHGRQHWNCVAGDHPWLVLKASMVNTTPGGEMELIGKPTVLINGLCMNSLLAHRGQQATTNKPQALTNKSRYNHCRHEEHISVYENAMGDVPCSRYLQPMSCF